MNLAVQASGLSFSRHFEVQDVLLVSVTVCFDFRAFKGALEFRASGSWGVGILELQGSAFCCFVLWLEEFTVWLKRDLGSRAQP